MALLDADLCGPSLPRLCGVAPDAAVTQTSYGWLPAESASLGVAVMSLQFLLPVADACVPWRGPRKTAFLRRALKDTYWGRRDWLVVDTPPGTSDEHLAVLEALAECVGGARAAAVIVSSPQQLAASMIARERTLCDTLRIPIAGIVRLPRAASRKRAHAHTPRSSIADN